MRHPRTFIFTCNDCGKMHEHLPIHCKCGSFDLKEKIIRHYGAA